MTSTALSALVLSLLLFPETAPLAPVLSRLPSPAAVLQEVEASEVQEALPHLEAVDAKVYRPTDHGLSALTFGFRPGVMLRGAEGPSRGPAPFIVRWTWRKGAAGEPDHDAVEFLDPQHKLLEAIPEEFAAVAPSMELAARGFGRTFLGQRLAEDFAAFRGRVVRRVVNGREELELVLEPRNPKSLRRLKMHLDRAGLPWQWDREYLDGSSARETRSYIEREEGRLLQDVKQVFTPGDSTKRGLSFAIRTEYRKVGGYILPARVTKSGPDLPDWETGTTEFLDIRVDDEV